MALWFEEIVEESPLVKLPKVEDLECSAHWYGPGEKFQWQCPICQENNSDDIDGPDGYDDTFNTGELECQCCKSKVCFDIECEWELTVGAIEITDCSSSEAKNVVVYDINQMELFSELSRA